MNITPHGCIFRNSPIIGHIGTCIHFAELLDTPISSLDIATITTNHIEEWEVLSPYLGLTRVQEIVICRNNVRNYNAQKRAALQKWKINNGDKATYSALITAAEAASNMRLADDVKTMLQTRNNPQT